MLHNALRASGRLKRPAKTRGRWAEDFDRLLDTYSKELVLRALHYYCSRLARRDAHIPSVLSGRGFLKHFREILASMGEDPVESSPTAKLISSLIFKGGEWPGGCYPYMPAAVQESLDNYAPLERWVREVAEADLTGKMGRFARYLLQSRKVCGGPDFVKRWFSNLGRRFCGWSEWSGELTPLIFSLKSKHLQALGRGWAQEWAANPKLWDELVKGV